MSNRKRIWWKSFNKDLLTHVVWNGVLVLTSNVPEEEHHPDGLNPSKSQSRIFFAKASNDLPQKLMGFNTRIQITGSSPEQSPVMTVPNHLMVRED
jgi:hypothetical protein